MRWRRSTGSPAAASSRPRSTSCGSCGSSGRRRTRAARGPTATSTCGAAARAGSAAPSRPRTGRSRGGRSPGGRRRRSTASKATIRATFSPACGCGSGGSRATCASRTPPGCATGSPPSSRSSTGSTSSARLRAMRACLVVPALEPGMVRAVFVAGCVVTRRTVPRGGGARLEVDAGLSEVDRHAPRRPRGDRRRRAAPAGDLHAPAGAGAADRRARAQRDPAPRRTG